MTEQGTADQAGKKPVTPLRGAQPPEEAADGTKAQDSQPAADAPEAVAVQSPAEAGQTQTVEVPADAPYIGGLIGDGIERDSLGQLPPPDMPEPVEGGTNYGE